MREYELIFIVHPELDETAFNEIVERVKGWISKIDLWGKRRLAYPIRKLNEGQYIFMDTQMNPSFGAQLERNLRFLEPVLRFSLIAK